MLGRYLGIVISAILVFIFTMGIYSEYQKIWNKNVFLTETEQHSVTRQPEEKDDGAISGLQELRSYRVAEEAVLGFICEHMLGKKGEVFTNLKRPKPDLDTLSESAGLLMSYSALTGRKELFDLEYRLLKEQLIYNGEHIRWKAGYTEANCNAAIDDLRIIGALLDAYDRWQSEEYLETARLLQQELLEHQTEKGRLYEFYDWKSNSKRQYIPLCYFDLDTMLRLACFDKSWRTAADYGLSMLKQGKIGKSSPFFYKYYSYDSGKLMKDEEASAGGGICLTYSIYSALHLAVIGEDTRFFHDWLSSEMSKGRLYAWYSPETLQNINGIESTAVYALASIYAKMSGDCELARKLIERMLHFMVGNQQSAYYGGFGIVEGSEFYSFDNLTALWALAYIQK